MKLSWQKSYTNFWNLVSLSGHLLFLEPKTEILLKQGRKKGFWLTDFLFFSCTLRTWWVGFTASNSIALPSFLEMEHKKHTSVVLGFISTFQIIFWGNKMVCYGKFEEEYWSTPTLNIYDSLWGRSKAGAGALTDAGLLQISCPLRPRPRHWRHHWRQKQGGEGCIIFPKSLIHCFQQLHSYP